MGPEKEKFNPRRHARCTHDTTITVRLLRWVCPDCDTENKIVIWPESRRREYWALSGKCGKCHQTRRLLDEHDMTIPPIVQLEKFSS